MNILKSSLLLVIALGVLLCISTPTNAASCGPVNAGALPNNGYYYCINETVQRYNYCGGAAGQLQGLKDHPLMCGNSSFNVNSEWQPKPETVNKCKGVVFDQCATLGGTTRCRALYSRNPGWSWSPSTDQVCSDQTITQTSNCGATRQVAGTKHCCSDWAPARNTICSAQTFTQTNSCGGTREQTGTKNCCAVSNWSPSQAEMCQGQPFTQTNNCGGTRERVGTGSCIKTYTPDPDKPNVGDFPHDAKIARLTPRNLLASPPPYLNEDATNQAKLYTRRMPDNRTGTWVDYPIVIKGSNLPDNKRIPVFTRGTNLSSFLNAKAANSMANNPQPSDVVTFCLDTDILPNVDLASCVDSGPRETTCGTHQMTQTCDCTFNTKGALYPLCDECEGMGPSYNIETYTVLQDNNWRPARGTVCNGDALTQTNDCGTTRQVTGIRNCEVTPPPALEWDYVGALQIYMNAPGAPSGRDLFRRSCLKFGNGAAGLDRYRKWLRFNSDNTRDPYSCTYDGDSDFCYESLSGEDFTPAGGVEEAIRIDFMCQ